MCDVETWFRWPVTGALVAPTRAMRLALIALLLPFALVGCSANEGDSCASHDDCGNELFCAGPDDPQVCGIAPRTDCSSDADCAQGDACHAIYDVCSADSQGSECGAPCTANSCQPGFTCSAAGACKAIVCGEISCGPLGVCDPTFVANTPVYDQTDGCREIACGDDGDCPAVGQCVNGVCQSGAGSCREAVAVP